jgi:hypothetical protein
LLQRELCFTPVLEAFIAFETFDLHQAVFAETIVAVVVATSSYSLYINAAMIVVVVVDVVV